jgi:cytochrome c oxidase assembly protein subunit 15
MSTLEAVPVRRAGTDVLALGFGTAVAMWTVGYLGRLPSVMAPATLLFGLFLVCLLGGGYLAGRLTDRGWKGGVYVGILCGLVNLMVMLSFLSGDAPNILAPSALIWIPGFVVASAVLGGVGAVAGSRAGGLTSGPDLWPRLLVRVAVVATFLLMAVGGLVTSNDAGLAVVDWPNSYGYNMFLFPLSRMTGGIYYEHAHRLFGALVGLTTVVVAIVLQRVETRSWVKRLAWLAVVMVIVQGILGGLRVTGHPTLSTSPDEVNPNIALAIVHGVLGQIFLGTMVALAVFTSKGWKREQTEAAPNASVGLTTALVGALVVQLVLGAIQRHLAWGLTIHITMAVIVAMIAVAAGIRTFALNPSSPPLPRLGKGVLHLIGLQLLLGLGAFIATNVDMGGGGFSIFAVTTATAHQWCGALLLAWSVALMLWSRRLSTAGD